MNKAQLKDAEARPCEYCGSDKVLLRRTVSSSGINMYFWLCGECQRGARKKSRWIGYDVIAHWVRQGRLRSPEDIPMHVEYASETRCVVCGQPGAEYHHWAPQSLQKFFGNDWPQWPGAYLCKEHHDLWHEVVTPFMNGRRGRKRAEEVIAWARRNV